MPNYYDSVALKGDQTTVSRLVSDGSVYQQSSSRPYSSAWSIEKIGNWDRKRPSNYEASMSPYTLRVSAVRYPYLKIQGIKENEPFLYVTREGYFDGAGYPYTWGQVPNGHKAILRDQAILDALSNLKDQKFNAGIAIAEASGVAKMATDIGRSISTVRRKFTNKDFKGAYKAFRRAFKYMSWSKFKRTFATSLPRSAALAKVPNAWLYYHFGIKPTLSDLDAVHQDWFRRHDPASPTWRTEVRGRAKEKITRNETVSFSIFDAEMRFRMEYGYRVKMIVQPKNSFLIRMAQMGGTNIPEAAWNGIPFSWVVDYFTSFGDWLAALDSGLGYEFGRWSESWRVKIAADSNQFHNFKNPSVPKGTARCLMPYKYRWIELIRTIPVTFYPPMYSVLPRPKIAGPTMSQYANMLSVLSGLFSGHQPGIRQ